MTERFLKFKKKFGFDKGFTFIELAFVMSIMAIMATIMLFNFISFNTKLEFDNLSQDIALRIVQAQKAAITGVLTSSSTARGVKPAYGVYFAGALTSTSTVGDNKFTYFTDLPGTGTTTGDKIYIPPSGFTCSSNPECISLTTITTGEYVDNICYSPNTISGSNCSSTSNAGVSIVFMRPSLSASIMVQRPVSSSVVSEDSVCLELVNPHDNFAKRTIKINSLGQVSTYEQPITTTGLCY